MSRPYKPLSAMINWVEIEELKKTKVRFGWYDTIDDLEVSQKLIEAVEGVAIAEGGGRGRCSGGDQAAR